MRYTSWGWAIGLGIAMGITGTARCAPVVALAGPDGKYDYASIDAVSHQLYVARGQSITAYDLDGQGPARSLGAIQHGHAVLPVAGGTTLLVTSGDDNSVRFLDARDGHETARVAAGSHPDGAVVDAAGGKAYVMNAKDGTVSIIDLTTKTVVGTVTLKPGLEFPALVGTTLFVNNEDANEIETVDIVDMKPGPSIALTGCTGPSGLAYDPSTGILISSCGNGKAAIVSTESRRLSALLPIDQGPDAVLLDAARGRAFIPCGESGMLDVVALGGRHGAKIVGHIKTAPGARTGALDPRTGEIYLPTARFSAPAPGSRHGAMIPGSFSVLVVSTR
jgi:YVTN family beta-propeller protein